MGKATVVLTFDKGNKQQDFQYIAEDVLGDSHVGYVYIQKPWYAPEEQWRYYIRSEQYKGQGICGGAESSGFDDVEVVGETVRPYTQIEEIKHILRGGHNRVRLVKSYSIDYTEEDVLAEIGNEGEIPLGLWVGN